MILKRKAFKEDGIFGELLNDDGSHFCFTLEHSYDCKPKVPGGTYKCVRGQHRLLGGPIETFEITGVVDHTGILIHYGNSNKDSDGCVLVGLSCAEDVVLDSRAAFAKFMSLMNGVDEFTLEVREL